MYKTAVRALVRHGLARLNHGDPAFLLRLAAPDAEISFPGDNSWAAMHRPVVKGRHRHGTHRGIDECRAFAERFAAQGIQFLDRGHPGQRPAVEHPGGRPGPRLHPTGAGGARGPVPQPGRRLPGAAMGTAGPLGGLRGHRAHGRLGPAARRVRGRGSDARGPLMRAGSSASEPAWDPRRRSARSGPGIRLLDAGFGWLAKVDATRRRLPGGRGGRRSWHRGSDRRYWRRSPCHR